MPFYHLSTPRLHLRLLQASDVEDVFQYASNPKVAENTSWIAHASIEDTQTFIDYILTKESWEPNRIRFVLAILEKGKDQVIGTLSFRQEGAEKGHVDYALAEAFWGRGYVSEALNGLLTWLFQNMEALSEIHSGCLSRNIGSVKVLEKNGFQLTQKYTSIREGKFKGEELETSLFIICKKDFLNLD